MSDTSTKPSYGKPRPKVPAFARFEGTSAYKKDRLRAREYERFKAARRAATATAEA